MIVTPGWFRRRPLRRTLFTRPASSPPCRQLPDRHDDFDGNAARSRLGRRVSLKLHLDLAALFLRIRATSGKPQSLKTADRVWLGEKEASRGSAQAFHTLGPEALDLSGDGLLAWC
jgi:hypothetical protein